MKLLAPLAAVLGIAAIGYAGASQAGVRLVLGAILPAGCGVMFVVGIAWRVLAWAKSPVPFRVPLTAGQQHSFDWLRPSRFDNPASGAGAVGRMALEVLLFRSLVRYGRSELRSGGRLIFREGTVFWLAALTFHYSLLVIIVRHLRLVLQPVPAFVAALTSVDGFFQIGTPAVYATDVTLAIALGYLLVRRLRERDLRYFSLPADYLPVLLLAAIVTTGVLMRYFVRVDLVAVKEMTMSLVTLARPRVSASVHPLVFAHLTLVGALLAAFPFTKLVHMAGIFLSPTRNLANNSRASRHLNPWNAPQPVHAYEEWETEFRDKLIAAGIPLDGRADHV